MSKAQEPCSVDPAGQSGLQEYQIAPFYEDIHIEAVLSLRPSTPGDSVVRIKAASLASLPRVEFGRTSLSIKQAAAIVRNANDARRVALVATSDSQVRSIPLHGSSAVWKPESNLDEEYHTSYPGYISSKNGPKSDSDVLTRIQGIISRDQLPAMDLRCFVDGETAQNSFARIIRGELEQWRVWESPSHVAFSTPFGNTPGYTVSVPRKHLDSDILSLQDEDLYDLSCAIWDVTRSIEGSASGASRVGIIFEGMEVDWAHAKLIPILGDPDATCNDSEIFSDKYGGSVSSKPGPQTSPDYLKCMQSKLTAAAASSEMSTSN